MGTTKRLTEEQMQRLREQIFDVSGDPMYFYSEEDFGVLDANARMLEKLVYGRNELLGMTVFDFHVPVEQHVHKKEAALRAAGIFKEEFVHHHVRKDGKLVPVQCSSLRLMVEGHNIVQVIAHDVSELVKVEEQLRERTRNLEILNAVIYDISSERDLEAMLLAVVKNAV